MLEWRRNTTAPFPQIHMHNDYVRTNAQKYNNFAATHRRKPNSRDVIRNELRNVRRTADHSHLNIRHCSTPQSSIAFRTAKMCNVIKHNHDVQSHIALSPLPTECTVTFERFLASMSINVYTHFENIRIHEELSSFDTSHRLYLALCSLCCRAKSEKSIRSLAKRLNEILVLRS